MKILMVIHQFLPKHLAGSEVYTYRLAQALRSRGHEVELFFTEIRPDRPQYELTRTAFDGIPCFEAVHNRWFPSFRHSYRDPHMERLFRTVVDQTKPDIVHLQHLHLHSIGYIELARRRGIPIVYTLHEYMLMCLNRGLLLRPGPTPCDGPEPGACARCVAVAYPDLPAKVRLPRLPLPLRRLTLRARRVFGGMNGSERSRLLAVRARRSDIQAELSKVDLFVAPSRFLRDRFVTEGMISPERVIHSDYGFFVEPFRHIQRRPSSTLRVGYVGTISEFKGVHLILDAFRELREPGIECRIYGDLDVFPDYKERLLDHGTPSAVRFMGSLENDKVADALADLDVLIVPSLWPENSPLTIHEAQLAGTPVLTADCGGMAELVEDGRTGLHFRSGNAADLRRQLLRLRREPGLLAALSRQSPPVKSIDEDAAETERRYHSLLERRMPAS